jgi:two-component system nitrogen regulation sensor histidine kinase GlnL
MLHQKLGQTNPLATELAGYISTETNRLSALVTRFLDFARPLHTELVPVQITVILDRALRDVAATHRENGNRVTVERQFEPNLPLVPLDESLCEQAFVNLIQNAYDAMGDEGGTLRMTASVAMSSGGPGVQVRIEDSGSGIPEALREQIFNPFMTTKKTGVGLGLSIVSRIIDGHHGIIRVETDREGSELKGAAFVMFFPSEEASENIASQSEDRTT